MTMATMVMILMMPPTVSDQPSQNNTTKTAGTAMTTAEMVGGLFTFPIHLLATSLLRSRSGFNGRDQNVSHKRGHSAVFGSIAVDLVDTGPGIVWYECCMESGSPYLRQCALFSNSKNVLTTVRCGKPPDDVGVV